MMKLNSLYIVVTILILSSCSAGEVRKPSVRPVKIAKVESCNTVAKDFPGLVEAVDYVNLAFRVGGQIIQLPIIEGQRLKKGDLVAVIDSREVSPQHAANKAAYEQAMQQLERNKRLLEREAISKQDYEISISNFERARSTYELSGQNMQDTRLIAPFSGSVEKRMVENFQRVNAGEGIIRLVNTENLRIKFTIADAYLYLLNSDRISFKVEFDNYRGKLFEAELEEYLNVSSKGTGIPVSIRIKDPSFDRSIYQVNPGFTCNIHFESDITSFLSEGMTLVPLTALFGDSQNSDTYVWTIDAQSKVTRRKVELHSPTAEASAIIKTGLTVGESVVIAGVNQLVEGEVVRVIEQ